MEIIISYYVEFIGIIRFLWRGVCPNELVHGFLSINFKPTCMCNTCEVDCKLLYRLYYMHHYCCPIVNVFTSYCHDVCFILSKHL